MNNNTIRRMFCTKQTSTRSLHIIDITDKNSLEWLCDCLGLTTAITLEILQTYSLH